MSGEVSGDGGEFPPEIGSFGSGFIGGECTNFVVDCIGDEIVVECESAAFHKEVKSFVLSLETSKGI